MNRSRLLVALVVVGVSILSWAQWSTRASAANPLDKARVRLYSGGQMVGEWEAVGAERREGDSFAFNVRRGTREVEVRIQGTYSYEVLP